ncbi:peptidase S8/S53 domain-containing protein [Truncatella angustata]|uniref:tripeptidyl-peptidase II n=1 Tax=Truncatella angustata TaxID=152316 RepID=A0A9P8USQ2_9PEZI|nr:peptidase S8/S53 domain-containing protein [Truncatella angustata]KAH6657548.1 peptidase S8/S53 domain-containing protein [Truncatella angustata]
MAQMQKLAMDIATPGHAKYGKHMTRDEIDAIIAPSGESRQLVFEWLGNHSLANSAVLNPRGNIVVINTTISGAETLLGTKYDTYSNTETGVKATRALSVNLPEVLFDHIETIQPTTFFGFRQLRPQLRVNDSSISPEVTYTTPTILASLYSFRGISTLTKGKMGIAGFIKQYPSQSDLKTFLGKFAISGFGNSAQSYTCTTVNAGTCPASNPGDEANLDVQYARAITSDIPNEFYSVGGNDNQIYEYLSEYLLGLSAAERPNVISVSYGGDESSVTKSVAQTTCNQFMQLGAAGVSVIFASGDSGVGSGCTISGKKAYQPDFPGGCPYVTMVGGTTGSTTESAWTSGGGGFSNYFTQPDYQTTQVQSWLSKNNDGNTAYYNSAGRAYPDVAAAATYFEIVVSGKTEAVDGTSCAAPTFASVIELVNSNRLAAGKAALGFLNPWLYGNASSALNDITSGKIGGCPVISGAGFTAIAGWDPATGLGTPNYQKLLAASDAV